VVSLRGEHFEGHVEQLTAPAGGGETDDHDAHATGRPTRSAEPIILPKPVARAAFREKNSRKRALYAED
jgi:hypothetical protein